MNLNDYLNDSLIIAGIKGKRTKHLSKTIKPFSSVKTALKGAGLDLPISQLDKNYYFISWEDWLPIIKSLSKIVRSFPWQSEFFDCDNRAILVSALCAAFHRINTCGTGYCKRTHLISGYGGYHYVNVIVTEDKVYLYDADYLGKFTELKPPFEMGNYKYDFKSFRFF